MSPRRNGKDSAAQILESLVQHYCKRRKHTRKLLHTRTIQAEHDQTNTSSSESQRHTHTHIPLASQSVSRSVCYVELWAVCMLRSH